MPRSTQNVIVQRQTWQQCAQSLLVKSASRLERDRGTTRETNVMQRSLHEDQSRAVCDFVGSRGWARESDRESRIVK